jgi:hypothetical protein
MLSAPFPSVKSGVSGAITPETLTQYQPQWIPAGAFVEDSANDQDFTRQGFGSIGSGTRENYWVYPFPENAWSGGSRQYIYFDTVPPPNWTSEKLKFIIHFFQTDEVTQPGNIKWNVSVRGKQDGDLLGNGSKQLATVTYAIVGTVDSQKWITAETNEITLSGITASDNILIEVSRDFLPQVDEESGEAFFIGLHVLWSNPT